MNKKNIKLNKGTDFQKYLKSNLKDKNFKKFYGEHGKQLEIAYQIVQMRKKAKITQGELAEKIGTTQSAVARIEKGGQNLTTDMMQKIASAFNKNLKIEFVR